MMEAEQFLSSQDALEELVNTWPHKRHTAGGLIMATAGLGTLLVASSKYSALLNTRRMHGDSISQVILITTGFAAGAVFTLMGGLYLLGTVGWALQSGKIAYAPPHYLTETPSLLDRFNGAAPVEPVETVQNLGSNHAGYVFMNAVMIEQTNRLSFSSGEPEFPLGVKLVGNFYEDTLRLMANKDTFRVNPTGERGETGEHFWVLGRFRQGVVNLRCYGPAILA